MRDRLGAVAAFVAGLVILGVAISGITSSHRAQIACAQRGGVPVVTMVYWVECVGP